MYLILLSTGPPHLSSFSTSGGSSPYPDCFSLIMASGRFLRYLWEAAAEAGACPWAGPAGGPHGSLGMGQERAGWPQGRELQQRVRALVRTQPSEACRSLEIHAASPGRGRFCLSVPRIWKGSPASANSGLGELPGSGGMRGEPRANSLLWVMSGKAKRSSTDINMPWAHPRRPVSDVTAEDRQSRGQHAQARQTGPSDKSPNIKVGAKGNMKAMRVQSANIRATFSG